MTLMTCTVVSKVLTTTCQLSAIISVLHTRALRLPTNQQEPFFYPILEPQAPTQALV
jgi:hypothetical protein